MADGTQQLRKRIALVAHDSRKSDLANWARTHAETLLRHDLVATGTTGRVLTRALDGAPIRGLKSGPLGGDQQLGAMIAEGELDMLIFFVDPMTPLPHDVDVKALTRLAILYNMPMACNRATADFLIASPHFSGAYERNVPDYAPYIERLVSRTVPELADDEFRQG